MELDYDRRKRLQYYGVFCLAGCALGFLFFNHWIACAALCALSAPAEKYYRRMLEAKQRKVLEAEFKDMLMSLSASFQTGRQMREAIHEARDNLLLVFPEDAPINRELGRMVRRIEQGGESEREALFDFAERSGCEDARNFVDIYYTCLTTGGDIVKVVNRTAQVLIEKMQVRREMEALMAQKKYEAKILTAMPVLILVFLRLNSPDYLTPLYTTAAGLLVMAGALAALACSCLWSERIMDIEV
ncbi:MAG: type II secretion system F family protein [Clostridiales Family XIII bacterium]|jgi:tight adherence protein B|nr:type II secretion system F family protein [Clostridiales Family XIII bacterium]